MSTAVDPLNVHIAEARALAHDRLERAEAEAVAAAMDVFFAAASPEDVIGQSAEQLYGGALALWRLARRRAPGTATLRVYNPRVDEHGWECAHTVIECVNDDMPFLVDSLASVLTEHDIGIHSLIHPVLRLRRDAENVMIGVVGATIGADDAADLAAGAADGANGSAGGWTSSDAVLAESLMQFQINQIADPERMRGLERELAQVLEDVRVAVADWRPMLARTRAAAAELRAEAPAPLAEAAAEGAEFLEWLADDHFTLLGAREYAADEAGRMTAAPGGGLGLLRDPAFTVFRDRQGAPSDFAPSADLQAEDQAPVLVLKANRRSTVHRAVHLDVIGVKRFDQAGRMIGELAIVGLFTKAAYNLSPQQIPLLRGKVSRVLKSAGFAPASHNAKALDNVLETYPRDELLQASEEQIFPNAMDALHLVTRPRTRLLVRHDRFGRFVSCIVYVPRERYTTDLRQRMGDLLSEAYGGRVASWTPAFTEHLTRVHMVVAIPGGAARQVDRDALEALIVDAVRSWSDGLRDALTERFGEGASARLFERYGRGFPPGYVDAVTHATALGDIEKMEGLSGEAPTALKFYRRLEDPANAVRLKLYRLGPPVPLSDCIPMMENLGLRVLEEHPFHVETGHGEVWIHDFHTRAQSGDDVDLAALRVTLEDAFAAIWAGRNDDDSMNRLVLVAGLEHGAVDVLRAYSRFLRQARIPYSVEYMEDALVENPTVARQLIDLFTARFDPATGLELEARRAASARIAGEIEAALEHVPSLDVDRILRRFLNAILSTLRTNAYQTDANGRPKDYVSFKFDCAALDDLPLPRPWREIFVYAPWVEGVHLRGGPVARGGLRWSDRKEDYRTEILGLVKAQQVKNAVIVPVGSKGGFLPKKLPVGGTREEVQAEAIRCYRTFLSGLLDVTDNLVAGAVSAPREVTRYDDDDPYLVVAADKGTATFSDIANDVAAAYGFWLGDAFASGGSNGYDHKKMGITARGAWEAVKRHFRELGHDTQAEPFRVIGVGDMSGDVFGNGMLLSQQIKLVAAFDHRDVFIDPEPDPAASFQERKRLFETPRTTWRDYDATLISPGGGVFPRSAKSIALSAEIRAMTGLTAEAVTPFELIRALLGAQSDLLWFGGIGTYVKAADESQAQVGDRANDAIRLDADEIGARVIGEGANLGVTQKGRIALARRGVKLNTDAVDNSAGVDCSDHEVNIKIALRALLDAGDMTEKQRNLLLAEMTDDVAELVLKTNYRQTQAITLVEARAPSLVEDHARAMRALEREGRLDRAVEELPDDPTLAERKTHGLGLTRPEISVIVAYAKIKIYDDLLASSLPDDPHMVRFLTAYMPSALRERHGGAVLEHRLRREIVSTVVANVLVDELGPSAPFIAEEETGDGMDELARAYVIAREVFGLPALTAEINALDTQVAAEAQTTLHLALADAGLVQAVRMLRDEPTSIAEPIGFYKSGVSEIFEGIEANHSTFAKAAMEKKLGPILAAGVPASLARRVLSLEFMGGALDIVAAARKLGRPVAEAADTYFCVGARLGLDWLRFSARGAAISEHWEKIAVGRMIRDLRSQQSRIAERAMSLDPSLSGHAAVARWIEEDPASIARVERLVKEFNEGGPLTVAKLAVASSQLRGVNASES